MSEMTMDQFEKASATPHDSLTQDRLSVAGAQPDMVPTRRPQNCDLWESYEGRLEGGSIDEKFDWSSVETESHH